LSTASPERLLLPAAAGQIETLVESPQAAPRAIALCCHPHPLFGGTMTNKVIHTVVRSFVASGAVAVRFNFRGVGLSEGEHDGGSGETADVIGLANWARERWPGLPLWLAGFSFGAWVALRAQVTLQPSLLVTVAPPVGRWDFSAIDPPKCPWLVIQGSKDELVDATAVEQWLISLSGRSDFPPQLSVLPEADHFFNARLHEVRDAVSGFVNDQVDTLRE
jgi:alpha/beta superfamily hydrolase